MSTRAIGWLFVAVQAALLGALIVLPGGTAWTLPSAARTLANVGFWAGIAVIVAAAISLGRSLNATPVPNATATLRTTGLYRIARHPIYSGVLLVVAAMVARSGSIWGIALGIATAIFFDRKARWEEQRLAERFADYPAYASRTGRFFPGW